MKKMLYVLCYIIASLAIVFPFTWGFGGNTAYPPSMDATKDLVEQIEKAKKHPDPSNYSTVLIESNLLLDITRVALLSRKEYQRASQDNGVYCILLLLTGSLLLTVLIQTEKLRKTKPSAPSNPHSPSALGADGR